MSLRTSVLRTSLEDSLEFKNIRWPTLANLLKFSGLEWFEAYRWPISEWLKYHSSWTPKPDLRIDRPDISWDNELRYPLSLWEVGTPSAKYIGPENVLSRDSEMDSSSSPSSPLIPSKPKETTVSLFCSRNQTLHFSLVSSRPEEGTVASANDVPRHPSLSFDSGTYDNELIFKFF